jgi:DNA-binding response OmpR family regulator
VLFVTVERNPKTVMAAKWLSVDGYLVKPISLKDLNIRIRAALARRNRG